MSIESWERELRREGYPAHELVRAFLTEFGGLEIKASGPGRDGARTHVKVDPAVASCERDRMTTYFRQLGPTLVPVGELEHGHAFLALDADGVAYMVMDFAARLGDSGDEALSNLIEGKRLCDEIFEIDVGDRGPSQRP